jgi:hypothetical protein
MKTSKTGFKIKIAFILYLSQMAERNEPETLIQKLKEINNLIADTAI